MAEAGYADGISGVELLAASVAPHAEILAPALQDLLRTALNINVDIRVTERALLVEEESAGNFDLVLDTPTISVSDFSAIGNLYFRTDASQNFGGYSNPEFDELLHAADLELDPARRAEFFRQLEDLLDEDPPWLLIGWTFHLPMWQSYFKGHNMEARTQSIWGRLDTGWLDQ
jgi:ABC-type transport system substrate-binding protein